MDFIGEELNKKKKKGLFKLSTKLDIITLVCMFLTFTMDIYISLQISKYFNAKYALIFFSIIFVILIGIFIIFLKRKHKTSLVLNIILCVILILTSLGAYRISKFSDKVFDNSETESVMLVAKKDSELSETTDLVGKKIAFITNDLPINTFVEDMLSMNKKENYVRIEYSTYKEAYEDLITGNVDLMVYTFLTKQRLLEDEIESWDNIKVVLEYNREMAPVESKKIDITKDPFNIYISGVDLTSTNINEKGSSDVNIIMSVNPKTKKVIMQTIPRDSWTSLPCVSGKHSKLTYAGAWGGINCSIQAIEEAYDIEINYYAKINFQGVVNLVDALGGITVNSDVAFCTSYGSTDCFAKGLNLLDGARALTFARIRKVFSEGDIARGRHQMEVIKAVIRKFSEEPSMSHLNSLLGAVENNFTTNFESDDIGKALELFSNMKSELLNIESYTMEGNMLWNNDEQTEEYLYYFYPNNGQVELFQERIREVMKK